MTDRLKGYEIKLNVSRDYSNPKWKPLHEGANFNATGRRHKKIVSKSNWFKRRGSSKEEEPARTRVKPQTPNSNEEVSIHQEREVPLIFIWEEDEELSSNQGREVPLISIREEEELLEPPKFQMKVVSSFKERGRSVIWMRQFNVFAIEETK